MRKGALCCALVLLAGCEKSMHDMYDQPKYKPLTPSKLFPDGASARPQSAGTVPYSSGAVAGSSSGRQGLAATHEGRAPLSFALLSRGRERFGIFCAPCHGSGGDGDGMVARRGFPAPPTYHSERLRGAPDDHFYQVISDGYGVMYPYADRILPEDRWAIVDYIRALQLSRNAPASSLDARDRAQLDRVPLDRVPTERVAP